MGSEGPAQHRTTRVVQTPDDPGPVTPVERAGIRRNTAEFEAELTGYLRRRLTLWSLIVAVIAAGLFMASLTAALAGGMTLGTFMAEPTSQFHFCSISIALVLHLFVRFKAPRDLRRLSVLDAVVQFVAIGCTLGMYMLLYSRGSPMMSGTLALILVGRALVVPSSARLTLVLSIPAAIGFLAVQLAHGHAYAWRELPYPDSAFAPLVVWNQALIGLGIGLAALASKVNFELRVKAYQARSIDQYVLEERIGVGAMGEVYRAHHQLLRRPTAIKMIRADVQSEQTLERFAEEVRHSSRLTHANTIRIYDYGQTADGAFFYAMELLGGADLQQIVDAVGPMSPSRVIHVLVQACGALAEAHASGVIHRDIKPGNLRLCPRGLVLDVLKVTDFGLVKVVEGTTTLTEVGQVCGSPQTVAPETLRGGAQTSAVDVYALGATGYFLLTGHPIFDAATSVEFAAMHLSEDPVPVRERRDDLPEDLANVLEACLAKDPEARPSSVLALRDLLRACADAGKWTEADATSWWHTHEQSLESHARARAESS